MWKCLTVSQCEEDDDEEAADVPLVFNLLPASAQMMPGILQLLNHKHKRRKSEERAQLEETVYSGYLSLILLIHEFFESNYSALVSQLKYLFPSLFLMAHLKTQQTSSPNNIPR